MSSENFIQKFLFAYAPLFGKNQTNKRELRRIINRLKKNDKLLIDPVQLKMKSLYGQLVMELDGISDRLKKVYENNIEGIKEELGEFETVLTSSILEKGNLTLKSFELKEIVKTAHSQAQGGVNTVDRIFKSRVKYFSHKDFKKYKIFIIRNMIFNDLVQFDYKAMLNEIPFNKNKKPGSFAAEKILKNLQDLYYISSLIPEKSPIMNDPVILQAFDQNKLDEHYTLEKIQIDIYRLIDIFKGPFSGEFIKNIVILISRNSQVQLKEKEYDTSFPKDIYDSIVEKYRKDRENFLNNENEKMLMSRMIRLFKDRHLTGIEVYTAENSELFHNANLPAFKYIIPMRIIKSFLFYFYSPVILSVLQEFQVEAEFVEKKQKTVFQEMVENFEMLIEKIKKFEEDLTIPSFSELLPYLEALKNGFLDNKSKTKAREAVRKVNDRADKLIQDSFSASINLHGSLTNIIVDINAQSPKLLSNALFLNHKKEDLCKNMEEAAELFNKYIKLLKIFAVHMDGARKRMDKSGF